MPSKVSSRVHTCIFCDNTFATKFNLSMHINSHIKERPFECTYCSANFSLLSAMYNHRKRVHLSKINPYSKIPWKPVTASVQGVVPVQQNVFRKRRCHSDQRAVKIDFKRQQKRVTFSKANITYEYSYRSAIHLKRYKKRHPRRAVSTCTFCNKNFQSYYHMANHMNTHTHERPFQCLQCDSNYREPQALEIHYNSQHLGKTFICTICSKEYKYAAHLRMHKKKHFGNSKPNRARRSNTDSYVDLAPAVNPQKQKEESMQSNPSENENPSELCEKSVIANSIAEMKLAQVSVTLERIDLPKYKSVNFREGTAEDLTICSVIRESEYASNNRTGVGSMPFGEADMGSTVIEASTSYDEILTESSKNAPTTRELEIKFVKRGAHQIESNSFPFANTNGQSKTQAGHFETPPQNYLSSNSITMGTNDLIGNGNSFGTQVASEKTTTLLDDCLPDAEKNDKENESILQVIQVPFPPISKEMSTIVEKKLDPESKSAYKSYLCGFCPVDFQRRSLLKLHLRSVHPIRMACLSAMVRSLRGEYKPGSQVEDNVAGLPSPDVIS